MKRIPTILTVLLISATLTVAQDVNSTISAAINVGNHQELSRFFDTKVELTIRSKESNYSRAQAEQVLRDFFAKDQVTGYQVLHEGSSKDGAQYAIGRLTTASNSYRTYILTKEVNGQIKIQQLRFEAND